MMVSGFLFTFLLGIFGGFLGELIKWYSLRESKNLPHYLKSFKYWLLTVLVIISGGLLAVLYGTNEKSAILIVNIGISAPLLIQSLARSFIPFALSEKKHRNGQSLSSNDHLSSIFKNVTKDKVWKFIAGKS